MMIKDMLSALLLVAIGVMIGCGLIFFVLWMKHLDREWQSRSQISLPSSPAEIESDPGFVGKLNLDTGEFTKGPAWKSGDPIPKREDLPPLPPSSEDRSP